MKIPFTVYDPDSGRILRSGECPEADLKAQGEHVLIGVAGDDQRQHVRDGDLVDEPPAGPPLAEAKAELRGRADATAERERRGLMPAHDVLALIVDALDDPDGDAHARLRGWRARAAAIEARRRDAHRAIDKARTHAAAERAAARATTTEPTS